MPMHHPFIQVLAHATSPVTSTMFIFFSHKINHIYKMKAAALAKLVLRKSKPASAASPEPSITSTASSIVKPRSPSMMEEEATLSSNSLQRNRTSSPKDA